MRDKELPKVEAAKRGDMAAFGWLVERHRAAIAAALRKSLKDYHLAQDATQETFLRALHGMPGFSGDTAFRPWLLRIAKNVAIDLVRRTRRGLEGELTEPDEYVGGSAVRESARPTWDDDDKPVVLRAIADLPLRERRMVWLRYGRGLTHGQVARECGLNEGAVKIALYRTRRRLRRLVRGW